MRMNFNYDLSKNYDLSRYIIGDISEFVNFIAGSSADNYPKYNIVKTKNGKYIISIAVAGFSKSELEVVLENNMLHISGTRTPQEDDIVECIYKGIAARSFKKSFKLIDNIKLTNASLNDGILSIELEAVSPEKPAAKIIEIN